MPQSLTNCLQILSVAEVLTKNEFGMKMLLIRPKVAKMTIFHVRSTVNKPDVTVEGGSVFL